jgi:hypothetical protein
LTLTVAFVAIGVAVVRESSGRRHRLGEALFRQPVYEDRVKILIASTPATGHLNPLLTIGRI